MLRYYLSLLYLNVKFICVHRAFVADLRSLLRRPLAQRDLERHLLAVAPDDDLDPVIRLVAAKALGVVIDRRDRLAAEVDDEVAPPQARLLGGAALADVRELDPLGVLII